MSPSHPHHDAVLGQAIAAHSTITYARDPEARGRAAVAAATAAESLRRVDELRYDIEPGTSHTYVIDTWSGQAVDYHDTAQGAEQIAVRRNTRNGRDGQEELAARVAEQTAVDQQAWDAVSGPLVPVAGGGA